MAKTADKIMIGVAVILLIGMSSVLIMALGSENPTAEQIPTTQNEYRVGEISKTQAIDIALDAVPGNLREAELEAEDGRLFYEVEVNTGSETKNVLVNLQGKILEVKSEVEAPDVPITGNPLDQASQAALDYIGEGEVTDTEIGDEEGYYEIEITLDSGQEVDVHLDENFNVLSTEYD